MQITTSIILNYKVKYNINVMIKYFYKCEMYVMYVMH